MKTCTKCKVEKQTTEFSKSKYAKSGLQSWCRSCTNKGHVPASTRVNYYKKWTKKDGSGVYEIYNSVTNESLYVGESTRLTKRLSDHKTWLKNISPGMPQYWKDFYDKISQEDNIAIRILEVCKNHKEKEKQYINQLKPKYNINGTNFSRF